MRSHTSEYIGHYTCHRMHCSSVQLWFARKTSRWLHLWASSGQVEFDFGGLEVHVMLLLDATGGLWMFLDVFWGSHHGASYRYDRKM